MPLFYCFSKNRHLLYTEIVIYLYNLRIYNEYINNRFILFLEEGDFMSNLGPYKWITSASKKVGGPINLLIITGGISSFVTAGTAYGVKKGVEKLVKFNKSKKVYVITLATRSNKNKHLNEGDRFIVLKQNKDNVIIRMLTDEDCTYKVSSDLLKKISTYK